MTKEQAIHAFWSSFDLQAYDENSVPSNATLPYITYSVSVGYIGDFVQLSASLWQKSQSWSSITAKADEIGKYIGSGGILLSYEDGCVWLKRGTPFYQRMSEEGDDTIRRIYLNISAEFISAD